MPRGTLGLTWTEASGLTWSSYVGTWALGQGTGVDSGTVTCTELARLTKMFTRTDAGTVTVVEAASAYALLLGADAGTVLADELGQLDGYTALDDPGTLSAQEVSELLIIVDELPVSAEDFVTVSGEEAGSIASESGVEDGGDLLSEEYGEVLVLSTYEDSGQLTAEESAGVLFQLFGTDELLVLVSEDVRTVVEDWPSDQSVAVPAWPTDAPVPPANWTQQPKKIDNWSQTTQDKGEDKWQKIPPL